MLERLRSRLDRARFFANVIRASKVVQPVRPARVAQFVRGARQTKLGPHLAIMFHGATHPDREAIVEYGESGVRRLTWGELDALINRLAHALVARGVKGGSRVALMLPNGVEYLIVQQALSMGIFGYFAGLALVLVFKPYFPRRLVLDPESVAIVFLITIGICLAASTLGIRLALKVDPAEALASSG